MLRKNVLVWVMGLIFVLSLYPMLQIVVNEVYSLRYSNAYEIEPVYNAKDSYSYQGHLLEVQEMPAPQLVLDGVPYPFLPTGTQEGESLYQKHMRASTYLKVTDQATGVEKLAVVQLVANPDQNQASDGVYRIIWIAEGSISKEEFSAADRRSPLYRAGLISFVSPAPLGWVENVTNGWPGLVVPFIFPFATFVLSGVYLLLQIRNRRAKRI